MTLQERRARAVLTATTLVNMTGSGVYITVLTLFLLEDRHLSAEAVAAVIAVTTLGGKLGDFN